MKFAAALISALALSVAAFSLADKAPARGKAQAGSDKGTCSGCREKNPAMDPASLSEEDAAARPAYAAASRYPETIDKIHCYCGCEDSPNLHHASLLTCFTSLHATGCEICRSEAEMAGKMKSEGSSDDEVKKVVESFYQK
jgi:hypothetical protein